MLSIDILLMGIVSVYVHGVCVCVRVYVCVFMAVGEETYGF